jgi:hypothetical protein
MQTKLLTCVYIHIYIYTYIYIYIFQNVIRHAEKVSSKTLRLNSRFVENLKCEKLSSTNVQTKRRTASCLFEPGPQQSYTSLCMPLMSMWFHMSYNDCRCKFPWVHTSRFVLSVILVQWSCRANGTEKHWPKSFALLLGLASFNCRIHFSNFFSFTTAAHDTFVHAKEIESLCHPANAFSLNWLA